MGADFEMTDETRRTWTCPRNRDELKLALSGLIRHLFIDDAYLETRERVIFADGLITLTRCLPAIKRNTSAPPVCLTTR